MENRTTDNLGTSEVHAHLEFTPEPGKGQGMSGKYTVDRGSEQGLVDQATDRMQELSQQAGDTLEEAASRARDTAQDVRGRAGELLGQARSRLGSTGLTETAQQYPLATLGIAFGIGFLLAGSSDSAGTLGKTRQQLRAAIVGGVTAALSKQLHDFMEQHGGLENLVENITGAAGAGTTRAGAGTQHA